MVQMSRRTLSLRKLCFFHTVALRFLSLCSLLRNACSLWTDTRGQIIQNSRSYGRKSSLSPCSKLILVVPYVNSYVTVKIVLKIHGDIVLNINYTSYEIRRFNAAFKRTLQ